MTITLSRRDFLKSSAGISTMAGVSSLGMAYPAAADPLYKISLAEWSIEHGPEGRELEGIKQLRQQLETVRDQLTAARAKSQ